MAKALEQEAQFDILFDEDGMVSFVKLPPGVVPAHEKVSADAERAGEDLDMTRYVERVREIIQARHGAWHAHSGDLGS